MNKTIDLPILASIIISCLIHACVVDGVSMAGNNVCPVEEEAEELNLQKHEQTVVLHTTKACWDISQAFRCKVKTNGTKLSYKAVPLKRKVIVYKCCHGYYETNRETCEICPEGYYGNNCALHCNCSENEICDNVVGCCDPSKKQCHIMQSDAVKEFMVGGNWVFPALLASLVAIIFLLFGTFFYRRKYKKEKDPDLPTLTYYPKEYLPPEEIEAREFSNPMFRRSAIEAVPIKIIPDEPMPIARSSQLRNCATSNEYATLDYEIPSSPYEVPLNSTPSPQARSTENQTNERIESV